MSEQQFVLRSWADAEVVKSPNLSEEDEAALDEVTAAVREAVQSYGAAVSEAAQSYPTEEGKKWPQG